MTGDTDGFARSAREGGLHRRARIAGAPALPALPLARVAAVLCVAMAVALPAASLGAERQDFDVGATGNTAPRGFWGNGRTLWVADYLDAKLYAYDMADRTRMASRDIETRVGDTRKGARYPTDVWSDGETVWVSDNVFHKVYAYRLSDGAREPSRNIELAALNDEPTGIWGDGETLWVTDKGQGKVYAYALADGARVRAREFDLTGTDGAPLEWAWGLWGDGDTFRVVDYIDRRVYAYRGGARAAADDVENLRRRNGRPTGLWSDGTTLWVSDYWGEAAKLYSYGLPSPSSNASLVLLRVSGLDVGAFSPTDFDYAATAPSEMAVATLTAVAAAGADVAVDRDDADLGETGHQVTLAYGLNRVRLTVTAADGVTSREYAVDVTRPAPPLSSDATLNTLSVSGVDIGTFTGDTTRYSGDVAHDVASTTVTASASHAGAAIEIADAHGSAAGSTRTVSLVEGVNEITISVTAEDGTTATYTVTVTRAAPPLTASWEDVPENHDGNAVFDLTLRFSEAVVTSPRELRYEQLQATNGTVKRARRVNGSSAVWSVRVQPVDGRDSIVALPADGKACDAGGVCTADGRQLSAEASATIRFRVPSAVPPQADLVVDVNRDGTLDAADDLGEDSWDGGSGAVFAPNLDDDDGDGVRDGYDGVVNGTADVADMAAVVLRRMPGLESQHSVLLEMEAGGGDWPRVFLQRDGGFELLLGDGVYEAALDVDDLAAADARLYVESAYGRHIEFDGEIRLRASVAEGTTTVSEDEVVLRGGPIIFSHPLQPAETVYVVDTGDNEPLVGALRSHLAEDVDLYEIESGMAKQDRWVQDFMQTGYTQRSDGGRVESARVHAKTGNGDRARRFLTRGILASGAGYGEPGGVYFPTMMNMGGNIEVIPPHTHAGRSFPNGRLLIGRGMAERHLEFLESQGPQAPAVQVEVGWLLVGHVDEVVQIVPDRNAGTGDRGWVVVIGSPDLAIELLEQAEQDGYGGAVVFANRAEETTVEAILEDTVLMDFNETVQTQIDAIRAALIAEVGLAEADFREVPAMWYDGHGGYALAYFPNLQNLLLANEDVFLADPEGPRIDGVDIWQRGAGDAFDGLGYELHFVDVYESYHLKEGSIHCGTNVEHSATGSAWWATGSTVQEAR